MNLEDLLQQCQQGNKLAWETFVRDYQGRIFRISFMYTRDKDRARDLAQEIFIRIYRKIHTWHTTDSPLAWITTIARNLGIDYLRSLKCRPPDHDIPLAEQNDIVSDQDNPLSDYTTRTRRNLIEKALGTLSDLNREIILLKEMQGLSFEEIAKMLNIPVGTAKSRSNRARLELAGVLHSLGGRELIS